MACQNMNWTHDTSTQDRSETNGVIESCPKTERRNSRDLGSKRSAGRMVGLCDDMLLLLAKVLDNTADGKTAFEKICGANFDGPIFPF